MSNSINNGKYISTSLYQSLIVVLLFFAGLINSQYYIVFMGYNWLNTLIVTTFYFLLIMLFFYSILNTLNNSYKNSESFFYISRYYILLVISVILKLFILFIQSPQSFYPGANNFSYLITFSSNMIIIILLSTSIKNMYYIKASIWSLGISTSLSAFIPFIFYPEMIGSRVAVVNGFYFTGAFWNAAVISFISIGWLLIGLSMVETSKSKRLLSYILFFMIVLASLAGLSRAALLSLIVSLLVYLIASNRFKKHIKIITLIGITIFFLFTFFPEPIENFQQRLDGGINISEEGRITIWRDYLENIPDYLLLGELNGNYKKYSATNNGPHSVLINWIVQFGILALIGYVILIKGILKYINRIREYFSKDTSAALYAWLAGYLSVAMINETGFDDLTVFVGIGLILAWGRIAELNNNEVSKL